jgi:toxin ParE1/3/4
MALEDRDSILTHIAEDNLTAALELDEAFEARADRACRSPTLY